MINRQIKILLAALSTSVATYYGQPYIDKFKMYQAIKMDNQKPMFCNSDLHKLLYSVGERLDIPNEKLNSIKLYHTMSADPIYYGSIHGRSTPSIGLPVSFQYKDFDDLDVYNENLSKIKWDEGYGLQLKQSVLLNEDEKKFALGQMLYMLNGYNLSKINHFANIGILFGWCSIYVYGCSKVQPHGFNRYLVYMVTALLAAYVIKYTIMNVLEHKLESEGDFVSGYLSWRANRSGLSYLKKCISRNQAFAEIDNELNGKNYSGFTKDGCETYQLYTVYDRLIKYEHNRFNRPAPQYYMDKLNLQKSQKEQQWLEATEKVKLPFE